MTIPQQPPTKNGATKVAVINNQNNPFLPLLRSSNYRIAFAATSTKDLSFPKISLSITFIRSLSEVHALRNTNTGTVYIYQCVSYDYSVLCSLSQQLYPAAVLPYQDIQDLEKILECINVLHDDRSAQIVEHIYRIEQHISVTANSYERLAHSIALLFDDDEFKMLDCLLLLEKTNGLEQIKEIDPGLLEQEEYVIWERIVANLESIKEI